MKVRFTERADKDYAALVPEVRKAFAKQWDFCSISSATHPCTPRNTTRRTTFGKPG
jgi:hypothetical protein